MRPRKVLNHIGTMAVAVLVMATAWAEPAQPDPDGPAGAEVAYADQQISVELSIENINRLFCPDPIRKLNAPESLKLTVEYQDKNAFLKLDPKSEKGVVYAITEDGSVFALEIVPKKGLPAKTIRLEAPGKKARENAFAFAALDRETAVVDLIASAFKDEVPESFTIHEVGKEVKGAVESLKIIERRKVTIDGVPLELREFHVGMVPFSGLKEVRIDEATFLIPKITRQPVAIALGRDLDRFVQGKVALRPSEFLRVFIVEKGKE